MAPVKRFRLSSLAREDRDPARAKLLARRELAPLAGFATSRANPASPAGGGLKKGNQLGGPSGATVAHALQSRKHRHRL